ncbi:Hypothetical predicted protein [Mytilus galloprovincialis]|uniref:Reverse transcriptase domain-containing protein n=1 Tax=Mytilus galloprovincialis TaxID=29158 RepID=A0A8B6HBA5_MYTGA|nr:Hypothetical predicted protein [Mytilus galloprovincialis]
MAKRIHPILTTNTSNCRDIIKLPIRTRFATGNYILQTNRAKFNQNDVSAVCRVCGKEDETISHFLISCTPLETERMSLLKSLREQYIKVLELLNINMHDIDVDFIHVIINPYHLVNYCENLYQNAVSYVKWDTSFSEDYFKIEQGVRQGETLSAYLYKLYINPLLNFLCDSGLGGKIGNINCCAPTCADDVALLACNPLDIQTMVDIAVDFKAEIHLKILSLFGNIARANKNSSEWRLAERQLQIKSFDSNRWFIDMKKICIKYNLQNPLSLLYNEMSKGKWKKMTTTAVHKYWTTRINEEIMYYSSLKYIPTSSFKVGIIHPLALANSANQRDINRIPIRIKIATGTYILQTNRAAFNQNNVDPTCKLCDQAEESISHFLLCCRALDQIRTPILKNVICKCSELLALQHSNIQLEILQLIINPFHYAGSVQSENDISCRIE